MEATKGSHETPEPKPRIGFTKCSWQVRKPFSSGFQPCGLPCMVGSLTHHILTEHCKISIIEHRGVYCGPPRMFSCHWPECTFHPTRPIQIKDLGKHLSQHIDEKNASTWVHRAQEIQPFTAQEEADLLQFQYNDCFPEPNVPQDAQQLLHTYLEPYKWLHADPDQPPYTHTHEQIQLLASLKDWRELCDKTMAMCERRESLLALFRDLEWTLGAVLLERGGPFVYRFHTGLVVQVRMEVGIWPGGGNEWIRDLWRKRAVVWMLLLDKDVKLMALARESYEYTHWFWHESVAVQRNILDICLGHA